MMQSSAEQLTERTFVELSGIKILINERYSPKILHSINTGGYENGERQVVSKLLTKGDRVIEVGAALGCVSMVAANVVGVNNIISFEANPDLIEAAQNNFALNRLEVQLRNFVLKNRVCWAGAGSIVEFHINKEFWASSLAKTPGTIKTVRVPTACFEDEIIAFGANALICDIEGGEIELLELADLSSIDKILMEIHYWAGRERVNKMIRKLILDGFTVDFDLSHRSIVTMHRGLVPKYAAVNQN